MKKAIILIILCFIGVNKISASFDMPQVGAKSRSLAEGFTASADNVTSIYCNPAGISQYPVNQIFASFNSLYHNLDDYIYNGSLIFSIYNIGVGSLAGGWAGLFTGLYQENVFIFSYANDFFNDIFTEEDDTLYIGVNGKVLYKSYIETGYTKDDPVFSNGASKIGVSADIGLLYTLYDNFSAGMSVLNINSPDMGIYDVSRVSRIFKVSFAYDFTSLIYETESRIDKKKLEHNWLNKVKLLTGLKLREKEYRVSIIGDFLFYNKLSLSGGYTFGEKSFSQLSLGLGFIKRYRTLPKIEKRIIADEYEVVEIASYVELQINYAFVYYLNGAHQFTYGNHYIEVGVMF